jgi:hypothetical protein
MCNISQERAGGNWKDVGPKGLLDQQKNNFKFGGMGGWIFTEELQ